MDDTPKAHVETAIEPRMLLNEASSVGSGVEQYSGREAVRAGEPLLG